MRTTQFLYNFEKPANTNTKRKLSSNKQQRIALRPKLGNLTLLLGSSQWFSLIYKKSCRRSFISLDNNNNDKKELIKFMFAYRFANICLPKRPGRTSVAFVWTNEHGQYSINAQWCKGGNVILPPNNMNLWPHSYFIRVCRKQCVDACLRATILCRSASDGILWPLFHCIRIETHHIPTV